MIKLDVVYDHQFRQVMNKLRALIEESGVVLVAFDDKKFRIIKPCTLSEIFRKSADEITGFASGLFHDPGQQCGRGCLAMRASDDKIMTSTQKIIFQEFRQRQIK